MEIASGASRRSVWLVALALAVGIALRIAFVATWHAPAGDGVHYYKLSQELTAHGRFALGPGEPVTYVRMPGYPLFLAYLAVRQAPISLERHLRFATGANVVLDLATALLVFLILRRFGVGPALTGVGMVLLCPILIRLSCYALTESLATFLATLELYLALCAMRGRLLLYAVACGLVAGLAQLVRADAVAVAPAVGLALLWAEAPLKRRIAALALCGIAAAVAFSPWPLRNLSRFGKPYFGGAVFRRVDGTPLPVEILSWERTWASSAPGQSYIDLPFVFNQPLPITRPGIITPAMYDSEAEHKQVVAIFERYNRERFSPEVVAALGALAHARLRAHPLRTLVVLPLERIWHLWGPEPEWELPMRSPVVAPHLLGLFDHLDLVLLAFALAGAALWLERGGRDERRLALIFLACIAARTAIFSFAIPNATNERYATEAYPMVIVLAAWGFWSAWRALAQWPRQKRIRPTSA